jgi:hypothetical protein
MPHPVLRRHCLEEGADTVGRFFSIFLKDLESAPKQFIGDGALNIDTHLGEIDSSILLRIMPSSPWGASKGWFAQAPALLLVL